MAEELQGLLDRIRTEGLEKAQQEAQAILQQAQAKAETITREAEQTAKKRIEAAETDAKSFMQRSISAVEQAARDVVLSVGDAIQAALEALVRKEIGNTLKGDDFAKLVLSVLQTYAKNGDQANNIDLLLAPEQKEQVEAYLNKAFTDSMRKGITVKSQRGIMAGFSIVLKDQGVEHDFRDETLTTAFMQLLRPQLADIVKQATAKTRKTK